MKIRRNICLSGTILIAIGFFLVASFAVADTNASVFQLSDWERSRGPITTFSESPMLSNMVAAGVLPALSERLPTNPLVVQPVEAIGQYGGSLRNLRPENGSINSNHWVWEYAAAYSPDMSSIFPNVLAGWEWSLDAKSITLHLREGMKWSDGLSLIHI